MVVTIGSVLVNHIADQMCLMSSCQYFGTSFTCQALLEMKLEVVTIASGLVCHCWRLPEIGVVTSALVLAAKDVFA